MAAVNTCSGTAVITTKQANKALKFHLEWKDTVILFGAPGIGKTEIVKAVAEGLGFATLALTSCKLQSHPIRTNELEKSFASGETTLLLRTRKIPSKEHEQTDHYKSRWGSDRCYQQPARQYFDDRRDQ